MLAVGIIALNVAIVLAIFYIDGNTSISALVGVMSGAVTNTPGLAAAQQTAGTTEAINIMAMGYAAAYPLGVIGIILSMLVVKAVFGIKVEDEIKAIEAENEESLQKPIIKSFEVTNRLIDGKTLYELHQILDCDFVVSRVLGADGKVIIPTSKTELHVGDKIIAVLGPLDEMKFHGVVGHEIEMDWEEVQSTVLSRRIVVTQSKYNGVALGSLRLHTAYSLNCTRVNRAGVDLLATPHLRLQVGDRLVVVGDPNDIERLSTRLGNSMKRLNQPNLITIFVGIMFGIIVGSINVGFGMKLGLAGGPLVVAILISRFGYKMKLVTYTSRRHRCSCESLAYASSSPLSVYRQARVLPRPCSIPPVCGGSSGVSSSHSSLCSRSDS